MFGLTCFELLKIWKKRSFLACLGILLALNLFMLWYGNLPKEGKPPLSAYRMAAGDMSGMDEQEKWEYIKELKEKADHIAMLQEILTLQAWGDEIGNALAAQLLRENPAIYETYMEELTEGGYLKYTDDLDKERALLDELYEEIEKIRGYGAYLESVEKQAERLRGISIFRTASRFGRQNVERSAADHRGLSDKNIRFYPSKGIRMAMESHSTDIFLLLSVFLFVGGLIGEEKEKGLFYLTRAAKNGIAVCMGAKLLALLIHVTAFCFLFYGENLLYASATAGLGSFSAQIQSVGAYMESSLALTLGEYAALAVLTKAALFFCFGAMLTAVSVWAAKSFTPQLAGAAFLFCNGLCYAVIPAGSAFHMFKYLSFFGMLETERLYGGYLNFNVWGNAVPRLAATMLCLILFGAAGAAAAFFLFLRGRSLVMQKARRLMLPFRPYQSLLRHEGYKILFTNRALLLLLFAVLLLGWKDLGKSYTCPAKEQYYADMMLLLEGRLTEEKEDMVLREQARFDEAFAQLARIEELEACGSIDKSTADERKLPWLGVLAFYPSFTRIAEQYAHIKAEGGYFIYDTGYRYLFGKMDESFLTDCLLLTLCMIFAFGGVMAMEYRKKSWYLLASTRKGRRQVLMQKINIYILCAACTVLLPWIFRAVSIGRTYPMRGIGLSAGNLPMYFGKVADIPIFVLIAAAVLSQLAALLLVGAVVLFWSWNRKSYLQASFLSFLMLALPLVLAVLGLDFAKWISIYGIYGWTGFL